jgi:DNA repair exonuclease SbcCD ATPase subunit
MTTVINEQEVETDTPAMKSIRNAKNDLKKERSETKKVIQLWETELEDPKTNEPNKRRIVHDLKQWESRMTTIKRKIAELTVQLESMEQARLLKEKAKKQAPPPSEKPEAPKQTVIPANRPGTNGLQLKKNTYIVVQPKAAGHEHRHYELRHLKTDVEKKLWHALFKLSQKIARESKYLVKKKHSPNTWATKFYSQIYVLSGVQLLPWQRTTESPSRQQKQYTKL